MAGAAVVGRSQTESSSCPRSPGNSRGKVAGVRRLTVTSGCWRPWVAGPVAVKQGVDPCPPFSPRREAVREDSWVERPTSRDSRVY